MRNLIAVPAIILSVILQSAVFSRITLLSGFADLPLVMLTAWALQDDVDSAWHWAVAAGILVGFVSGMNWVVPVVGYIIVVALAKTLRARVWQAPLLAMFSVTFLGTIVFGSLSLASLRLLGVPIAIQDAFGLLILPSVLLNMLLAVPVYAVMRDLAHWAYPSLEVE
jgi:hypothetical protein